MTSRRQYEWEIRGFMLIRGKPTNSHLGVERAETDSEAITRWIKGRGRFVKASCITATLSPDLTQISRRNLAVAAALTLLGSLALTSQPAWGVSEGNTLEIHTPSPRALVREGAISDPIAQWQERRGSNSVVLGSSPNGVAIFHGGSRLEGQERNYDPHQALLDPIDHGETCKTVYANHTQALHKRDAECVTAGETAPISPAVGGKRTDCLGVAAATFQALREQTGYLQACQAGSSSDGYSGVDESHLSDKAGGSPAPISNIFTGQTLGVAPWEDTGCNDGNKTQVNQCTDTRKRPVAVEASPLKRSVRAQTLNGQTVWPERHTPLSPTASEATPTPRFNCRAENRPRTLRESEDTAADGGQLNL